MGQDNNSGRNATLDQHKRRAAGRQNTNSPERQQMRDAPFEKGKTAGAFGKSGRANRKGSQAVAEGGGAGGGTNSKSSYVSVGRSTKPAKKRS